MTPTFSAFAGGGGHAGGGHSSGGHSSAHSSSHATSHATRIIVNGHVSSGSASDCHTQDGKTYCAVIEDRELPRNPNEGNVGWTVFLFFGLIFCLVVLVATIFNSDDATPKRQGPRKPSKPLKPITLEDWMDHRKRMEDEWARAAANGVLDPSRVVDMYIPVVNEAPKAPTLFDSLRPTMTPGQIEYWEAINPPEKRDRLLLLARQVNS